jgi:hypothetical protein
MKRTSREVVTMYHFQPHYFQLSIGEQEDSKYSKPSTNRALSTYNNKAFG